MNILNFNDKLIISQNDKDILDKLNQNRNHLEEGFVWEAWVVSIRIWLPNNYIEGSIDISFPVGEDNSFGFLDALEAIVKKDSIGVYRLYSKERGSDIPKHFISIIENNLLTPVSMGAVIPYHGHVYGKAIVCKIADLKAKQFRYVLENVEIISPYENEIFVGLKENGSLPKNYKKRGKKETIDYKEMIVEGENEKIEFKSSTRWDYRQSCVNKELQKTILKTITGFLNSNGGTLLIGVDDKGIIIGIENDIESIKKKNLDGYRLFLSNLISDNIGKQFNSYINIEFPNIDGNFICSLVIKKSDNPAFLKDSNQNKFFI
ncbi:MAG: ATP-binding protein, partial [Proteobacteria bacterium]|nr:ATP-binding protein [Pseudomonadota bacterium]